MDNINSRLDRAIGHKVSVAYTHGDTERHPIGTLLEYDHDHITLGFDAGTEKAHVRTYLRSSLIYIQIVGETPDR